MSKVPKLLLQSSWIDIDGTDGGDQTDRESDVQGGSEGCIVELSANDLAFSEDCAEKGQSFIQILFPCVQKQLLTACVTPLSPLAPAPKILKRDRIYETNKARETGAPGRLKTLAVRNHGTRAQSSWRPSAQAKRPH